MTVYNPTLPNANTQTASAYKNAIDNTARIHNVIAGPFAPHQTNDEVSPSGPDMTVTVESGYIRNGQTLTSVGTQTSAVISAPASSPRIDRIVIDNDTGAIGVVTGSEAASPTAPAIPGGKHPVAQVLLQTTSTSITNSMITDERTGFVMAQTPTFNVKDYGALGDAATNDTSAIQSAIDAARAFSSPGLGGRSIGAKVIFPTGAYIIDNLDVTDTAGLMLEGVGGAWGVALYASEQSTTAKAVIDCSGSSNLVFRNIIVSGETTGGAAPTIVPLSAWFLAETTTRTSDKISFEHCRTTGQFQDAAIVAFGVTNSNSFATVFANDKTDGYAAYIGKTDTFSNSSIYQTVNTTPAAATEVKFFGCEFHARDTDNTGTVGTIFLDSARTASFHGCLIDNGTASGEYVRIKGAVEDIGFFGCKFYSETGTNTNFVFNLDASAAITRFTVVGCVADNAASSYFVNGGAGATATLVNVQGWKSSEITSNISGVFQNLASNTLCFANDGTTLTSGSTLYIGIGRDSATESVVQFASPRSGVIKRMYVKSNGSPGGAETHTYTLRKNGSDQALSVTITSTATTGSDTGNEIGVSAGDLLSVGVVASASAGAAGNVSATVEFGDH